MRNSNGKAFVVWLMGLALAACAVAPEVSPSAANSSLSPDTKGDLSIYTIGGPPLETLNAVKAVFTERYPNVKVDIKVEDARLGLSAVNPQQASQFASAIISRHEANQLQDIIFNADLFVPQLVDAGVLMDVEPLTKVDASNVLGDIYPNVLALGKVPSRPGVYMLPIGLETVQMYYNKTLFEKAEVPLPTSTTTWDDFLASCKRIMTYAPGTRCFSLDEGTWWPYFLPWIAGYGGSPLSADGKTSTLSSPQARAGLAAYAELWNKQDVALLQPERGRNCFITQKCVALFQISAFIGTVRQWAGNAFEWDVERVPVQPRGQWTGLTAFGFSITQKARNPQLAWEFLKLIAARDVQLALFKKRQGVPMLKSLQGQPEIVNDDDKLPPKNMAAFINAGEMGLAAPSFPVQCGSYYSGKVLDAMTALMKRIIDDPATVDAATTAADAEIQACLDSGQ